MDLLRKFTRCITEMTVSVQTYYMAQSQYTRTGPGSPKSDLFNTRRPQVLNLTSLTPGVLKS